MADGQTTRAQQIGLGLQGFGAGIQGNLPQFQQAQNQRAQLQAQQQERQRLLETERQKTVYTDAQAGLNLLDDENFDGLLTLGMNRLQSLQQFPGADPSDTQRLTQLATAARNGDKEAEDLLRNELKTTVEIGRSLGVLQEPKLETKVVGDFLVDTQSGDVVFDATGEGPRQTKKDVNGRERYVDDGELVFPQIDEIAEGLEGKDRIQAAEGFRNEIAKENGEFQKIANSWDRIAASADEPSAAGDLALIFNFMKMLDPGSTVREGEFATAQNTAGVPGRVVSFYNNLLRGERLNVDQRADFFGQAQNIFDASSERANQITNEFVRIAEGAGLTREEVVVERGAAPEVGGALDLTGIPTITSQEEFDALPSGAEFIEDGIRMIKQ